MRSLFFIAVLALGGCHQSHQVGDDAGGPPGDLCTRTGGHVVSGCCDYHCGDFCTLRCVRDVCMCSRTTEAWDPTLGCAMSPMCVGVHGG